MEAGLHLLGAPSFSSPPHTVELSTGQATHLAAFLTLRSGWVTRDSVVDAFWPDTDARKGRHNLAQLLYEVRRAPWGQGIKIEPRRLRWDVDTDVARFRRAASDGAWSRAVDLYSGELLEGVGEPSSVALRSWLETEREDLRETWREALRRSADELADSGEWAESARVLRRLLASDGLREEAVRSLMLAEARAGRRDAALKAFDDFRERLQEELGLEPLPDTSALASKVRSGEIGQISDRIAHVADSPSQVDPERGGVSPGPVFGLPASGTALVGRALELAQLHGLLRQSGRRLVTIVGPGGTGKTSLAAQFTRERAGHHASGAAWVSLATSTSETDAVVSVIATLGLKIDPELQALVDVLADRDILLVLDQAEHLPAAGGLAVTLMDAAPAVRLVVTSRASLDVPGETVYQLGGLSLPPADAHGESSGEAASYDAVALLLRAAKRVRPDFRPAGEGLRAVYALTRLLGGNPLGIELAAGWLRLLEPAELLDEVQRDLDVLRSASTDTDPTRASLRAVFESSWSLLTDPEREAMRRLAVFRGGCDRDSALAVADVALNNLLSLTNRSLLRRSGGSRFEPHPVVEQFAEEKLAETPDLGTLLEERHTAYFQALAEDADRRLDSPQQLAALQRLDTEAPNIVAVLERAIRAEAVDSACQLVAAMGRPWRWRGRARYGLEWCDRIEGLPAPAKPSPARVRMLLTRGSFLELPGDYAAAYEAVAQALSLAEQLADFDLTMSARTNLATVTWRRGELDTARELLEQVAVDCRVPGKEQQLSAVLGNLATVALTAGDPKRALAYFDEALGLAAPLGQVWKTAGVISSRGVAHAYAGDLDAARADFERALELQRSIDDRTGMSKTLANLGVSYLDSGDLEPAEEYIRQALPLFEEAGNRDGQANSYVNLGIIRQQRKDLDGAFEAYEHALVIRWEIGALGQIAPSLVRFLDLAVAAGQLDRACVLAGAALAVAQRSKVPLPASNRADLERALEVAGDSVKSDRKEELMRHGAALRDAEAVDFALNRSTAGAAAA